MIRADLLYDQLKGRKNLTGLQTRLIYLVHARRMRMKLIEMQISAAAGINEHNEKLLEELADSYTELLFPGIDRDRVDSFEEQAKKYLAEEVKNVYRVRRIEDKKRREAELEKILGSGTAGGAMAAQATMEEQRAMRDLRRKYLKPSQAST